MIYFKLFRVFKSVYEVPMHETANYDNYVQVVTSQRTLRRM